MGAAVPISPGGASRRGAVWQPAIVNSPAINRIRLQSIVLLPIAMSVQTVCGAPARYFKRVHPGTARPDTALLLPAKGMNPVRGRAGVRRAHLHQNETLSMMVQ
jgi:hypothetical protein